MPKLIWTGKDKVINRTTLSKRNERNGIYPIMCKICKHPDHAEMVIAYARVSNYRTVARRYGVDHKTLQRQIVRCVYEVMTEVEEKEFRKFFGYVSEMLTSEFMPPPKKRPKSMVTKEIKYTWSRRSWKKNERD